MNFRIEYDKLKNLLIFCGMIHAPMIMLFISAQFATYFLPHQSGNTQKIYRNLGMIITRMVDPTQREIRDAEKIYSLK